MQTFLGIGSGPGIGLATAERFAREGFRIVLSSRSADRALEFAKQLRAKGHQAESRTVDAAAPDTIAKLVTEVEREHGAIDVVHYNAASIRYEVLSAQHRDTFNADLAVNVGGAQVAIQAVSPKMFERGAGSILLTGGGYALSPSADCVSLSVGKAGVRALAQALFESFKTHGVHVATVTVAARVSPGSEDIELIADRFWQLHTQPKESWTVEEVYRRQI